MKIYIWCYEILQKVMEDPENHLPVMPHEDSDVLMLVRAEVGPAEDLGDHVRGLELHRVERLTRRDHHRRPEAHYVLPLETSPFGPPA